MKLITDFKLLKVGECSHPECIAAKGGRITSARFPALVGLLKHKEKGWILYDTGYSDDFFKETVSYPNKLYRITTPVNYSKNECLISQLENLGLNRHDIGYIIISHFHADHIAGLKSFNNAKFITFVKEYHHLMTKNKVIQLKNAYLKELVPPDFTTRTIDIDSLGKINTGLDEFSYGFDIFNDNSLIIINLPGHTKDQAGLLFWFENEKYFLIADAAFSLEYLRNNMLPNQLVRLITYDWDAYKQTFSKLRNLTNINMIPSHCNIAMKNYCV